MAKIGKKLWDKGEPLDQQIERFTVGRDPEIDLALVPYDALASAAHASMLAEIGVLAQETVAGLNAELRKIAEEARRNTFKISRTEEDCHTAIENRLTSVLGEAGARIHTGRSRNDQVIAALRLYGREMVVHFAGALLSLTERLIQVAEEHQDVAVAGYSHTRQAMPSTMGHFFLAHAEGLLDAVPWIRTAFNHLNRSPLGSASGFGVALDLDRERVADLLGFDRVQRNTLAVQNDRGKTEYLVLGALLGAVQDISRLAHDVIWYSSDELQYLSLSQETTTGSSIMPQKRNPDIWELARATAGQLRARHSEIGQIFAPLSSGYHRDLQLTKEPFVTGMRTAVDLVAVVNVAASGLRIDRDRCRDLLQQSIAATDAVYARVRQGEPFRHAYRAVAMGDDASVALDPAQSWKPRTHLGAPGAFEVKPYQARVADGRRWVDGERDRIERVWKDLFPDPR